MEKIFSEKFSAGLGTDFGSRIGKNNFVIKMFIYTGVGKVSGVGSSIELTECGTMPWAGARYLTSNESARRFFSGAVEDFKERERKKDYVEVPLTRLPGKDCAPVWIRGPQGGLFNLKKINGELYATLPMRGWGIIDEGLLDISAGRMDDAEESVPCYRGWKNFILEEGFEEVAVVKKVGGKNYLCVPKIEEDNETSDLIRGKVLREASKPAFREINSGLGGTEFVGLKLLHPTNAAEFVIRYADSGLKKESRFKAGRSWDVNSGSVEAIMIARAEIEGEVKIYDTETRTPTESWHRRTCMVNLRSGETSILRDGAVVNKEFGLKETAYIGDVLNLIEKERAAEAQKKGKPLDSATGVVSTGKVWGIIQHWPIEELGVAPALEEILKRELAHA